MLSLRVMNPTTLLPTRRDVRVSNARVPLASTAQFTTPSMYEGKMPVHRPAMSLVTLSLMSFTERILPGTAKLCRSAEILLGLDLTFLPNEWCSIFISPSSPLHRPFRGRRTWSPLRGSTATVLLRRGLTPMFVRCTCRRPTFFLP